MTKKRVKAGTSKDGKLTSQQERFAQLVAGGLSQSAAYRDAYNVKRSKPETVHENASRLMADGKVSARVAELRKPVIQQVQYNLVRAMAEAEEARALALMTGQTAAAVSAVTLKAKLNGLLVEDRKNERRPLEDVSDEELDRIIEQARRELASTTTLQ